MTDTHFERILLCFQHTLHPILVQVIGVYLSPKCKFAVFTQLFECLMRFIDDTSTTNVIGYLNMKSIVNLEYHYNTCVERYMAEKCHFLTPNIMLGVNQMELHQTYFGVLKEMLNVE